MEGQTVIILAIVAFSSFEAGQAVLTPCEDNAISCILQYFGKNTDGDTADTYAGLSDVAVAIDFELDFPSFNHKVYRPAMTVAGLNAATIQQFTVADDLSTATITLFFPEVHLSGDQRVVFSKAGEDDVTVEYPFDYRLTGITVTAEYELASQIAKTGSQKVSASMNNAPTFPPPAKLTVTSVLHPWVAGVIVDVVANREVFWQQYMNQFGPVVFNLYWDRILAVA